MGEQVNQAWLRVRSELLPKGDWEDTLRLLATEAAEGMGSSVPAQRVFDDAVEREQTEPTYIGMGMAVPHTRVEGVTRAGVYLGISQGGIPWPQEEAHIVALLIVPWERPELHLQLLARLARWRRGLAEESLSTLAQTPGALEGALHAAFAGLV